LKLFGSISLELSGDSKSYFGFTFDKFTKLDCQAFSGLFEAVTSNFMVTTSSLNSTDVDPK